MIKLQVKKKDKQLKFFLIPTETPYPPENRGNKHLSV